MTNQLNNFAYGKWIPGEEKGQELVNAINGDFVCQGGQFSLKEIEVLTAVLDIDDVHAYRNRIRSLQVQVCCSFLSPL